MEIARLYLDAQASFLELVESLGPEGWSRPVPCTPGWDVHDVLSHVAGVCDDITNGRIEGAGTPQWSQTQVDRGRQLDAAALIDTWRQQAPAVADVLQQFDQFRPPIDVHAHEHDIRHALALPAHRDSELIDVMRQRFTGGRFERPVQLEFADRTSAVMAGDGDADPVVLSGLDSFEFVRSRLGRRTRAQVGKYAWSQAPGDSILDSWFVFGPAKTDIHE